MNHYRRTPCSGLQPNCFAALFFILMLVISLDSSGSFGQTATPAGAAAPVTLTSGWLMQDVAHVKDTGEAVSKVGYAPPVYVVQPYVPPPTASANPPTETVVPPEQRYSGGRGGGRGGARGGAPGALGAGRGAATQGSGAANPGAAAGRGTPGNPPAPGAPGAGAPAARGGRGGGAAFPGGNTGQWPVNPEKNRPNTSPEWVQAPPPSSDAWYNATVPGTVLTTLVNNNIYPDPLYGENNRPNIIPESLAHTSYWYRNEFTVPQSYAGKHIWLNFDGINYFADVWVNGTKVGTIKGAFVRGNFDISSLVKPGEKAAVAVFIIPCPHPGDPWEKTVANQRGPNGAGAAGPLGLDGPTFVASIGWDWVPGIRDRQIGIWQNVTLSASGPVLVEDPWVVTDLPLPSTDSADITIQATVRNLTADAQTGVFTGKLGDITFQSAPISLKPNESQQIKLDPKSTPQLHMSNPKLWWPNGFGDPYLYPLHLSFDIAGASSDTKDLNVGIRKLEFFLPGGQNLTLSVNGVRVFAKGGDWGMDDAMKRISPERLDTLVKLHKEANYNIIRNWVGQATSEDFYRAYDKYSIMIWNDFFQANGQNGQNPSDDALFLANVRDTVLRFRNHPSIAVWCGRNESNPPPAINTGNAAIVTELDPTRIYQPNSAQGNGASSNGGGYSWRTPLRFYQNANFVFNTECGTVSIPNLESIQSWMPEKDWFDKNFPNDDWAEHDLVTGAGNGTTLATSIQGIITTRYGAYNSLADFVRKAQMANYEDYRAMYESRASRMFSPCTAIITWMSNPAQPCTVWQIYDYSLEPFSSFFGVQKACEPVHIMMTQDDWEIGLLNNLPKPLANLKLRTQVFNLDGTKKLDTTTAVASAPASTATGLGHIVFPADVSPVHFVKLELRDAQDKLISDNFYWRETTPDDFTAMDKMPDVQLDAKLARHDAGGNCLVDVTLSNNANQIAVMAHMQLRNARTNARVLPVFYSENYISLVPGESKTITITAALKDLGADKPLVVVDGWNTIVKDLAVTENGGASITTNANAHVARPTVQK